MTTTRKPTPAQLAAREKFAAMARAGKFKRAAGKTKARKRNPTDMTVANTILDQLGGARFRAMTGAHTFVGDARSLSMQLPGGTRVRVTLLPSDLYRVERFKLRGVDVVNHEVVEDVYADKLRATFEDLTKLRTSLGTLGRNRNPRKRNPSPIDPAYYGRVDGEHWAQLRLPYAGAQTRTWSTTRSFDKATPLTVAESAAFKSYCDEHGHACELVPVDTIDFEESTRGKLLDNPRASNPADRRAARARATHRNTPASHRAKVKANPVRKRNSIVLAEKPARHRGIVKSVEVWREDGGFEYGMDAVTPQLFHFTTLARASAKSYRSWKLPPSVIANPKFQAWANDHNRVGVFTLRQLQEKMKSFASLADIARQREHGAAS